MRRSRGGKLNMLFSVAAIAVMWAAWIIAAAAVKNEYVVPSFVQTIRAVWVQLCDAYFWQSFAFTLLRSFSGWLLAFVCAVVFVAVGALSVGARKFIEPFVRVFRTLPTMAITLMLLLWSSPRIAPIVVTFLMLFPISYSQLSAAYYGVDPKLKEMTEVYGVSKKDMLLRVCIPQMMPSLFVQAGPNLSLSLKVTVSAEVLSFTFGSLGGIMQDASIYSDMPKMFAVTLILLIVGAALEFTLGFLTKISDRWLYGRSGSKSAGGRGV